jgi:hypothetical protein
LNIGFWRHMPPLEFFGRYELYRTEHPGAPGAMPGVPDEWPLPRLPPPLRAGLAGGSAAASSPPAPPRTFRFPRRSVSAACWCASRQITPPCRFRGCTPPRSSSQAQAKSEEERRDPLQSGQGLGAPFRPEAGQWERAACAIKADTCSRPAAEADSPTPAWRTRGRALRKRTNRPFVKKSQRGKFTSLPPRANFWTAT